jgi:carboxymethylenebutenolidase
MKRVLPLLACVSVLSLPASAQHPTTSDPHAGHTMEQQQPAAQTPAPKAENLPAAAETAAEALKSSPRHQEWVDVKFAGGAPLKSFVVYPERKDNAPVVIVIHEIFGMADWVRAVADQLAKEGFIAIAPDLLSGKGPNGGGTQELGDQVGQAIRTLTTEEIVARLNAVRDYALTISAANRKVATIGFCWGGGASFNYALNQPALDAAVSYYGPMPTDPAAYARAKAPILGLYGGNDQRVNANIPAAKAELEKHGVTYDPHIFDGAGHGFLRAQGGANGANMKATQEAWPLTLAFLRKYTEVKK